MKSKLEPGRMYRVRMYTNGYRSDATMWVATCKSCVGMEHGVAYSSKERLVARLTSERWSREKDGRWDCGKHDPHRKMEWRAG